MIAFLILCAVYCTVRGAWTVGVEICDAAAEIVDMLRGWRS